MDYDALLREAVKRFWAVRTAQQKQQGRKTGRQDTGEGRSVTGGAQLDGFRDVLCAVIEDAGLDPSSIHRAKAGVVLPGFFRPNKQWDIVVIHNNRLLAAIELKSQVGSFGNNFNNRTEEAVGSAHDLWTAFREGAFEDTPRPWLGYLVLLEEAPQSTKAVKIDEPHFKVFPEFVGTSYARRYELLARKLVRERLYDCASLILTDRVDGVDGQYEEPAKDLSFAYLAASLEGHVKAVLQGLDV